MRPSCASAMVWKQMRKDGGSLDAKPELPERETTQVQRKFSVPSDRSDISHKRGCQRMCGWYDAIA